MHVHGKMLSEGGGLDNKLATTSINALSKCVVNTVQLWQWENFQLRNWHLKLPFVPPKTIIYVSF